MNEKNILRNDCDEITIKYLYQNLERLSCPLNENNFSKKYLKWSEVSPQMNCILN